MFDIGVTELILVSAIALLVLGPEKLPLFFRTVGVLIGRAQIYVANVKEDIEKQIELEDLSKTGQTISDFSNQINKNFSEIKKELSEDTVDEITNNQSDVNFEKKIGNFIGSPSLSWPDENSYVRLCDRLRERNRQRLLKNRNAK